MPSTGCHLPPSPLPPFASWDPEPLRPGFWQPGRWDARNDEEVRCDATKHFVYMTDRFGNTNNALLEFAHLMQLVVMRGPGTTLLLHAKGLPQFSRSFDHYLGKFVDWHHEERLFYLYTDLVDAQKQIGRRRDDAHLG